MHSGAVLDANNGSILDVNKQCSSVDSTEIDQLSWQYPISG